MFTRALMDWAIQVAAGSLFGKDWLSCYYRDDSILLSMGMKPYELILQLFAKKDDHFLVEEPITATLL